MVKKVGNLIPNTFFITKGSGESDLEKHAGSYHMALYDAGISDFKIGRASCRERVYVLV